MRGTVVVATFAALAGFCFAAASSYAALRYNIWKGYGYQFQLGYVVGYLDAVTLAQRKDTRLNVPIGGDKNFDKWVAQINAFYEDPANQSRGLPDAMFQIGTRIRTQMLHDLGMKRQGRPVPTRTTAP